MPQQADEFLAIKGAEVLKELLLASLAHKALQPDLMLGHLDEIVEVVTHDALGDEPQA